MKIPKVNSGHKGFPEATHQTTVNAIDRVSSIKSTIKQDIGSIEETSSGIIYGMSTSQDENIKLHSDNKKSTNELYPQDMSTQGITIQENAQRTEFLPNK